MINYTLDEIKSIAITCNSATDFKYKYRTLYNYCHKKRWLCLLQYPNRKPYIDDRSYVIYGYFDYVLKFCYVGLTNDIHRRHNEHNKKNHRTPHLRQFDIVKQYFIDNSKPLPKPIILEENLNLYEAQDREDYWKTYYESNGWTLINTGKTGKGVSSLGNIGRKWTIEKIEEVLSQCKSRNEFRIKYRGAYHAAIDYFHDWYKSYVNEHLPKQTNKGIKIKRTPKQYAEDEYMPIINEHPSRRYLYHHHRTLFNFLKEKNLLDTLLPFKSRKKIYFTKEEVYFKIKDCKTKTEARNILNPTVYEQMKFDNHFNKIIHNNKIVYFTELANNSKNQKELKEKHCDAYLYLKKYNLLDIILPKTSNKKFFTIEQAIELAKSYKNRNDLTKHSRALRQFLDENNLTDTLFPIIPHEPKPKKTHKPKPVKPTIEDVINVAKQCTTKLEFRENFKREYDWACRYKLLKTFTWLKGTTKWSNNEEINNVIQKAHQYTTRHDFRLNDNKSYQLLARLGLLYKIKDLPLH